MRIAEAVDDPDPVLFEDRSRLLSGFARNEQKGDVESLCLFDELPRGRGIRPALELESDRLSLIAKLQDGVGPPICCPGGSHGQSRDTAE